MSELAAFDLDGTLTRRDTLRPFLCRACGTRRTATAALAEAVPLSRAVRRGGEHRDAAKAAVLRRLLAGRELDSLTALAEIFADEVVARGLRPETRGRIDRHRREGHTTVIVSASPELYVAPIARRLGIDHVLATRLEVGDDGRLTGRLLGANCRGPEKAVRLREWLGNRTLTYAYGDSAGDAEMLAMAKEGALVARKRRA